MNFTQKEYGAVVECAACKGTGLRQTPHNDGSCLCRGCNGAGKQALRFLPKVETLGEASPIPTEGGEGA